MDNIFKIQKNNFLAPILFGVLGFFIALNINPTFQSQATLVIEESTKNIVNIEEVYGGEVQRWISNNNYINNQIQIIESDEVLGNILLDKKIKVKAEGCIENCRKFFNKIKILNFFKSEKAKKMNKKY